MTLPSVLAALALAAFGLFFGCLLALLGVAAALLYQAATRLCTEHTKMLDAVTQSSAAANSLRLDMLSALAKFDPDRLHEASQMIQRGAQSLATQTQSLGKLLYASAASSAAGINQLFDPLGNPQPRSQESFGLDDEAADDARMLAERARWAASGAGWAGSPPPTSLSYAEELTDPGAQSSAIPPDPFAGLSHEDRQRALDKFWAERRAGVHTGKTAAETLAEAAQDSPRASRVTALPDLTDLAGEEGAAAAYNDIGETGTGAGAGSLGLGGKSEMEE